MKKMQIEVRESSLLFLCCTATIRELPFHSQNLGYEIQYCVNFFGEELKKLVIILSEMIKGEYFERDVNDNLIRNKPKHFIDSKFTIYEEYFAMVFIYHLKIIRTSFMVLKMSSEQKRLSAFSVTSSKRSKPSKNVLG